MRAVRSLRALPRDRRGGVTMITAGSLMTLLGMLALAVDVGSVYLETRRLQGIADDAVLTAVSGSNGRSAADAAVGASGWGRPYTLAYTVGGYTPDPTLAPNARFSTSGTGSARLSITSTAPLFFAAALVGRHALQITRSATATRVDAAAFSIGTRLAAASGGLVNAYLSALAGSSLNLSVADVNGLVSSNVDVLQYIKALQLSLNANAATFNDVLATQVSMPQLMSVLSSAVSAGGNSAAAAVLQGMSTRLGTMSPMQLGAIINLGATGNSDHAASNMQVQVNVFDLVRAILAAANGTREVQLNLGAGIPGVLSTTIFIATGQRSSTSPWLTVTDAGQMIISTAQSRTYLQTRVGASSALGALGVTSLPVPLYVELAQATGKLSVISCSRTNGSSVTLAVQPAVGHASIATINPAQMNDFTTTQTESAAAMVQLPLVTVTGQSRIDLGGASWQSTSFSASDISSGTVHTLSTNDMTTALASSLVSRTSLTASVIGIGVNVSTLTSLVGAQLQAAAPSLDALINDITDVLGVHLGQADVSVDGVRCGVPALVA